MKHSQPPFFVYNPALPAAHGLSNIRQVIGGFHIFKDGVLQAGSVINGNRPLFLLVVMLALSLIPWWSW